MVLDCSFVEIRQFSRDRRPNRWTWSHLCLVESSLSSTVALLSKKDLGLHLQGAVFLLLLPFLTGTLLSDIGRRPRTSPNKLTMDRLAIRDMRTLMKYKIIFSLIETRFFFFFKNVHFHRITGALAGAEVNILQECPFGNSVKVKTVINIRQSVPSSQFEPSLLQLPTYLLYHCSPCGEFRVSLHIRRVRACVLQQNASNIAPSTRKSLSQASNVKTNDQHRWSRRVISRKNEVH